MKIAPSAPSPPAIPKTLDTLPTGNDSDTTILILKSQVRQITPTILKIAIVINGLGIKGVNATKGAKHAMVVSIILLALRGAIPFLTILSDQEDIPIAPMSAIRKGIQPNKPICTKDNPDCSCKYPGSQNKQKYQTGSLINRTIKIPHKLFFDHNSFHANLPGIALTSCSALS